MIGSLKGRVGGMSPARVRRFLTPVPPLYPVASNGVSRFMVRALVPGVGTERRGTDAIWNGGRKAR